MEDIIIRWNVCNHKTMKLKLRVDTIKKGTETKQVKAEEHRVVVKDLIVAKDRETLDWDHPITRRNNQDSVHEGFPSRGVKHVQNLRPKLWP